QHLPKTVLKASCLASAAVSLSSASLRGGWLTRICGTTSTCDSPRAQWTTTTSRSSETTSTSAPFPVSPPLPPLSCPPSLLQAFIYSSLISSSSASLCV
ncbi:hypothetical protein JOQ06_002386, partial [Pogonophryne albipinna]